MIGCLKAVLRTIEQNPLFFGNLSHPAYATCDVCTVLGVNNHEKYDKRT
jgi:hypothetical protein